jgi:hypothetical protein
MIGLSSYLLLPVLDIERLLKINGCIGCTPNPRLSYTQQNGTPNSIIYKNLIDTKHFTVEIEKMHKLKNLKKLTIDCINTISTCEYLKFLPLTLESLEIWNFDNTTINDIIHLKNLKFLKLRWLQSYSYWSSPSYCTYSGDYKLYNVSTCINKLLKTSPTLCVVLDNICKTSIDTTDKEAILLNNIKFISA